MSTPVISAVIPTRNRPKVVGAAVQSALAQTFGALEVVVVVDGPDAETVEALGQIQDSRLTVLALQTSGGGANARNRGVEHARGAWIAFLDDDDEWLPNKLAVQLDRALAASCADPIVTSRFIARLPNGDQVWPQALLQPKQSVSEYLLARNGLHRSDGFIATPTILARRSLLLELPFTPGLKRHQDWDWVLRAVSRPSVEVCFCPEVLVVCNMQDQNSLSRNADFHFSWTWARSMRPYLTDRAYASFLTCHVAWQAARQNQWRQAGPLLLEAMRSGPLSWSDIGRYMGFWLIPQNVRSALSRFATKEAHHA